MSFAQQSNSPPLRTYPRSHLARRACERHFGYGKMKSVACHPIGAIGHCRQTVEKQVHERGGQPVWGWLILYWPGLYVEALRHCIWQRTNESLIDLSRKYPGDPASVSTFIIDRNLASENRHPSTYYKLNHAPEVEDLLLAAKAESDVLFEFQNRWRTRQAANPRLRTAFKHPLSDDELLILQHLRSNVVMCIERCLALSPTALLA